MAIIVAKNNAPENQQLTPPHKKIVLVYDKTFRNI